MNGKKLPISHGKYNLRPTTFEVFITVKNLEGVAISGSGDISGKGRFVADAFYAEISGSGDMDLKAEPGSLSSKISGSGDVYYRGRPQINTKISGSGSLVSED